jgi:hypothetical protein
MIGLSDCAGRLRRHVVGGDVDQRRWATAVCGDERYCWVLLEGVIDQGLVSQNTEPQWKQALARAYHGMPINFRRGKPVRQMLRCVRWSVLGAINGRITQLHNSVNGHAVRARVISCDLSNRHLNHTRHEI